jgi:ATP-dependent Clp protease ATP-binding subunit ClpC
VKLFRFTDRSRKSVEAACEEARMLGHDALDDEDLLLGILGNEDGMAVRMLKRMGVSPEALEERLFELRGEAT